MTFIISTMRQMCLLVAMLMMCSVSGRGSDNLREAAETEPTMGDNRNNMRRQETTVCGRRQIQTSTGRVPWQVKILRDGFLYCGGAIINEFWIITAPSCVNGYRLDQLKVLVGHHNNEGLQFNVQRVVTHTQYLAHLYDYDIALIQVQLANGSGIRFNNYIQPICLPTAGESPADNANLTVTGWEGNQMGLRIPSSVTITTGVLPVINHNQCKDEFPPGTITDRVLCVEKTNVNTDVCILDYGGPATFQTGDTHILAGIIISYTSCAPQTNHVFLTNILVLRDWINDRINEFSNATQRVIPPRAD